MRIFPSWSTVMNEKVGSMVRLTTSNVQSMNRVDRVPVRKRCPTQRVYAQFEMGAANGVDVDDVAEIANIGENKIFLMRGRGSNRFFEWNAFDSGISRAQQFVRTILHPARDFGIGWTTVGRVVLETSVLGRVVRWRDDDAVGEVILATTVVHEDGARDDRSRRYTVVFLNDRFNAIRRQHFERGALGRRRNGMRILPHAERPVDGLPSTVIADCLCDRENVRFVKGAMERRPAVPARPEADQLVGVAHIGLLFEVLLFHARNIDQHFLGRRLACQWRNRCFSSRCLRLCF